VAQLQRFLLPEYQLSTGRSLRKLTREVVLGRRQLSTWTIDSLRCHCAFCFSNVLPQLNGAKLSMDCRLLVASVCRGFGTLLA
jgi:hypothetical protein